MYNNKGKRDILIFPKFDNMNLIQEVRNKYDRLSNLVAPHITLGQGYNIEEFKYFDYQFTTIVDEVSIEFIGENGESIIIENIKLYN